jgi:hypothetical protein
MKRVITGTVFAFGLLASSHSFGAEPAWMAQACKFDASGAHKNKALPCMYVPQTAPLERCTVKENGEIEKNRATPCYFVPATASLPKCDVNANGEIERNRATPCYHQP